MSVQLIFKIAAVGILVSVLCQVLKHSGREEQAFLTSLAGLLLVLFWILPYIQELFHSIESAIFLIRDGEGGYELNAVQIGLVGVAARCLRFSLKMENLSMASTKCGGQHFHFSEYCRETGDYP